MPTIVIASLEAGEGRTTVAAALGALLAEQGRTVRLIRFRSDEEDLAAAQDDARALASVPGCQAEGSAVSAQDAQAQSRDAGAAGAVCLVEAPAGDAKDLASALSARVVLVTSSAADLKLSDVAATAAALGDSMAGVIVLRQKESTLAKARAALTERGLACLGVLPEDRLLAGPTIREMAETLRASRLFDDAPEDEAVEFVMLGPISSDPGQPYFLQHGHKAVVNRFDKMDLHLAALATEPDCLILTGGQQPSPYLFDRVAGGGMEITVLLAPEGTVRTIELVDELYERTRFSGQRKIARAADLFRQHVDLTSLV
jgi:BioD-like phosphotransacetylase family protein